MESDRFEAAQRAREWFHGLRLLPGAWTVARVDGRAFTRFTESRFGKPFDKRFSDHMISTARALVTELEAVFAFTESDEISVLLAPSWDMFGRSVEKLVSISAGVASAAFTAACGQPAHFDSRIWMGTNVDDVVDYFSWRQADATRCALNGWCYWTLRAEGQSPGQVSTALESRAVADKNELLFARGINFSEVPAWQRRGIAMWWETFQKEGFNPVTKRTVIADRRRLHVERELPIKAEYRQLVSHLLVGVA